MEVINHAEIRHERHERNANANNDNQQAILFGSGTLLGSGALGN
jgi:hypothetical protein